ncbi:hypothetical protein [Naasia sp. SYSU D00057]|uniref:hypothetical protein n=1 Tax=Naasia sp. SYSU D00057 TaxID=2817380 RepID=UPI001B3167EF|nr:hypothetical protein [Naasia sp. SYSU D00057]
MTRERYDGRGYWSVLLIRGVLAAVLAVVITFSQDHTPVFGLAVYGVFALLQGLVLALSASRSAPTQTGVAITLASGVVGLASGVLAIALLFVSTGAAAAALVPAVAVSAGLAGTLELVLGVRDVDAGPQSRDRVVVGVASLLLAVAVLLPASPVVTVGLIGAYGAIVGVYLIIAALSLLWSTPTGTPAPDSEEVPSA